MDRQAIYIEADEEITSVVDKLKGAEGAALDVVIPKEALMLQSVINIKLLKRQAESLGKEITIVTQDKVGTKLATQIGIPVVAKEGQTPKEVNMSEVEKPEYSESDIEMKPKEEAAKEEAAPAEKSEGSDSSDKPQNDSSDSSKKPKEKNKNWFKRHWKGSLIAGGFVTLALMVFAYIYVPLANVNILLAAQKESVDFTFVADKNATDVNVEEQTIPAREVVEEVEKQETKNATGKKTVGEKASGTATIYNDGYDSDPITIIAGTRLVTASGLTFKTNSNATLPGSYLDGGEIVVTTVDVAVTSDDVGSNYNIAADTNLSIPALNTNKVYGKSKGAFSGGSSREVTFVTATDIKNATEAVTESADSEAKTKVEEALQDGERVLDGALEYEEVSSSSSVASGAEAESFSVTVKVKATALAITEESLKNLAENVLADSISANKEVVEANSLVTSTELTEFSAEDGNFEATLAGEAYIATKIEEEDFRNSINGDPEAVALEYINSLEGVESVEIRFFPSFYKRVPRINSHIYIKTEISKTQQTE